MNHNSDDGRKIMIDLKTCPFCGGEAKLIRTCARVNQRSSAITSEYVVSCTDCTVSTPPFESDIRQDENGIVTVDKNGAVDAKEAWNRRAKDE